MIVFKNSIICIEEIDATFHPQSQAQLAHSLLKYSQKYNNQLFITTHNIEFLDSFLSALYSKNDINIINDDLRVITLKQDIHSNKLITRVLSGTEAYEARYDFKMELR
jgi:AAA15 family ATPase/GTPase